MFNLSNNKCYNFSLPKTFGTRCLGSAYGWVAMIDRDFKVQLFNPITKAQIIFPTLEPMIDKDDEEDILWFLRNFIFKLVVLKVPRGDHDEFVIMAFNYEELFFAKHGDQSWTLVLVDEIRLRIVDVVGMNDHVFALYNDGAIIYWNVMEFYGLEGVKPKNYCPGDPEKYRVFNQGCGMMYLVQFDSDLLMVLRDKKFVKKPERYITFGFKVYKLSIKDKSWEEIEDLGDVALFLGNNSSMCISGPLAKGLQRSIYFTDDAHEYWGLPTEFGGHDMGVYDLKCGKILQFYEGSDTLSNFCPSTWFFT